MHVSSCYVSSAQTPVYCCSHLSTQVSNLPSPAVLLKQRLQEVQTVLTQLAQILQLHRNPFSMCFICSLPQMGALCIPIATAPAAPPPPPPRPAPPPPPPPPPPRFSQCLIAPPLPCRSWRCPRKSQRLFWAQPSSPCCSSAWQGATTPRRARWQSPRLSTRTWRCTASWVPASLAWSGLCAISLPTKPMLSRYASNAPCLLQCQDSLCMNACVLSVSHRLLV